MRSIIGLVVFFFVAQAVSFSAAQEVVIAEGYSNSGSTFVFTDDLVPFTESVVIDVYDSVGFVDTVTLYSLGGGEGAIGFSNFTFAPGTVLLGQANSQEGNPSATTVVILVDPPTHREQGCKIVDGGHI